MDINVTINCPDLLMAATTLAKAFTCRCHAHMDIVEEQWGETDIE